MGRVHATEGWGFLLVGFVAVLVWAVAVSDVSAHRGHGLAEGRIAGQPDFERLGQVEIRFHPEKGLYSYKRPNESPLWFHRDEFAPSEGAFYALPIPEEPVVCATSGHRIRVMYGVPRVGEFRVPTETAEVIRSFVRRMNWKILNESVHSSAGAKTLQMRVQCDANGQISVLPLGATDGRFSSISYAAEHQYTKPSGAEAVKNLVFFDGADPGRAGGYGEVKNDAIKSASDSGEGNDNRIVTATAAIYNYAIAPWGYWGYLAAVHELFHIMGAVQPTAPFATGEYHCVDGIDVMCYRDRSSQGVNYNESRCPTNGYFDKPEGVPLDCGYDTYFDALEEGEEWLHSHWNTGGEENPFLVQPSGSVCDPLTRSRIKIGDMNGDGKADIFRFTDPADAIGAANVWRSNGTTFTALGQVQTGFGIAYQDRIADWDGDGDDDVFQFTEEGRVDAWRSNATSYTQLSQISSGWAHPCEIRIGDINGDHMDDILRFDNSGNGYAWRSTGPVTGYTYIGLVGTGFGFPREVRFADIDGDGDDDALQFTEYGRVDAWRSNGTSYTQLGQFITGFGGDQTTVRIGDRDGDGDDDLFQFTDDGRMYYWRSDGTRYTYLGLAGSGFGVPRGIRVADINGDQKADILRFKDDGTGWAWIGNGTAFTESGQIGSGFGTP